MGTEFGIGDVLLRGYNLARNSFGQEFMGHLAQPVFVSLRDLELKKLSQDPEEEAIASQNQSALDKGIEYFKLNFSFGDLASLVGFAAMYLQKIFVGKSETKEKGFFEQAFKTLVMIMAFGGSLGSMVGRAFNFDKVVALGKDYSEAQIRDSERQGIKIFREYSVAEKEELKREAQASDKLLVYRDGVRESILERYARDDIGGLLDGEHGTGKTEGVRCILGKWAQRVESEGFEAKIAELNLGNFDEYLKMKDRNEQRLTAAMQAVTGLDDGNAFVANRGISVLEVLVNKIQNLASNVNRHNQKANVRKQKLAIFIDEFDKVFDPNTLRGCDKSRLKNLLIQFNELFVKNNLLLTSNRKLEQMMQVLREELYIDENQTGEEVWKPMYDRLVSKNRVLVEIPSAREQAEIIAGRILSQFAYALDLRDFGIELNSGVFELDRKKLADVIEAEVTTKLDRKINGRQLRYTCDDLSGILLGLARQIRLQRADISDQEWEKLSPRAKIERTGAKINKEILLKVLRYKIDSIKIDMSAPTDPPIKKPANSFADLLGQAVNQIANIAQGRETKIDPNLVSSLLSSFSGQKTST